MSTPNLASLRALYGRYERRAQQREEIIRLAASGANILVVCIDDEHAIRFRGIKNVTVYVLKRDMPKGAKPSFMFIEENVETGKLIET